MCSSFDESGTVGTGVYHKQYVDSQQINRQQDVLRARSAPDFKAKSRWCCCCSGRGRSDAAVVRQVLQWYGRYTTRSKFCSRGVGYPKKQGSMLVCCTCGIGGRGTRLNASRLVFRDRMLVGPPTYIFHLPFVSQHHDPPAMNLSRPVTSSVLNTLAVQGVESKRYLATYGFLSDGKLDLLCSW